MDVNDHADPGAEMDQFTDALGLTEHKVTLPCAKGKIDKAVIEYVSGEGDPPYVHYRITVEPIGLFDEEHYQALEDASDTETRENGLPLGDADTADERRETDPGFTHQPQDTD